MSSALAIAAVTNSLKLLIEAALHDVDNPEGTLTVSVKPPGKVMKNGDSANQLNLFLYQVEHNAAWANQPLPPSENGPPPLALTLYYLLTAYGKEDDDLSGHKMLGYAMSALHDNPLLRRQDINLLFGRSSADSQLYEPLERVRITRQPISIDEMSKLWSTFQAEYRVSVAYQVSVVLIESSRDARSGLPILQRGRRLDDRRDQGVAVLSDTIPPYPIIEEITEIARGRASVLPGEVIHLRGHHLGGKAVTARLTNPRFFLDDPDASDTLVLPVEAFTDNQVTLRMPNNHPAGIYTLALEVTVDKWIDAETAYEDTQISNEIPLAIAPVITSALPIRVSLRQNVGVTIRCRPDVQPWQRVSLLLNGREIRAESRDAEDDTMVFSLAGIDPGEYRARLRVDGVDSHLVDLSGASPVFDERQKVIVEA